MHIKSFLFLPIILITACSTQAVNGSSPPYTPQKSTVLHDTPVSTSQNISEPTVAASFTNTIPRLTPTYPSQLFPSITLTATPINWNSLPKLRYAILSVIDIEDIDQSASTTPFVTDITYELNGSCLWDCAKFHYTLEHGTLTIMLLRAGSHEKADSTVKTLHNEFLPTAWVEYTMDDLSNMPPGSWVIVDPPSSIRDMRTSTASISYGSIVIFITYSQSFCDYEPGYGRMCEGDLEALALNSVKFMTAQMKKLEEMGYPK